MNYVDAIAMELGGPLAKRLANLSLSPLPANEGGVLHTGCEHLVFGSPVDDSTGRQIRQVTSFIYESMIRYEDLAAAKYRHLDVLPKGPDLAAHFAGVELEKILTGHPPYRKLMPAPYGIGHCNSRIAIGLIALVAKAPEVTNRPLFAFAVTVDHWLVSVKKPNEAVVSKNLLRYDTTHTNAFAKRLAERKVG